MWDGGCQGPGRGQIDVPNETALVWEDREALELAGGMSGGTLDRFQTTDPSLEKTVEVVDFMGHILFHG